jgi:two-component system response regulator HydG
MRSSRRALLEAILGREEEAEEARAAARACRAGAPSVIAAWNDFFTAASLLESGRMEDARRLLENAAKAFRATGFAAGEIECRLALADLHLRAGPRSESDLKHAARSIELARTVPATAPSSLSPRSRDARAALLDARLGLARRRIAASGDRTGELEALVSRASADLALDADARIALELVASISARLSADPTRAGEALRRLEEIRNETARRLAPADAQLYLARDPWKRFGLEDWRPLPGGRALDGARAGTLAGILALLASSAEPIFRAGESSEVLRSVLAAIADEAGAARVEIALRGRIAASWGSRPSGAEPSSIIEAPIARGGAQEGSLRLESAPGRTLRAEDEAFLVSVAHALAPYLSVPAGWATPAGEGGASRTEPLEPTRPLLPAPGVRSRGRKPPSTEVLARLLEPEGVIAAGREMRRILRALRALAASDIPVLITGESGTGKNVAARILHLLGPRAGGPYVAQNAAAVPPDLFEADLFGYEQGAFTGAEHARTGFLFQAGGGTFHIEEVGDLGLELQRRLLRVIEEKAVRPLGSARPRSLDVRFVASTQRDIEAMVRRGEFRKDLYYRLDGARIHLPPLRQRLDELPELVRHYWRELAGPEERFPRACLEALAAHDWPGNIRELISVLRRVRLEVSGSPRLQDVRAAIGTRVGVRLFSPAMFGARRFADVLRALEESYLEHLVETHGGDLARIASELGTTTRSIYRRFEKLGLKPRDLKR